MSTLDCPNCGAKVEVDQRFSHMAVCKSCRSVITFGEDAVELRGDLSLLPPSRSQLFVGAQGKVGGLDFIVLGRVRYGYERGYWDEWYLQCGDGETAWITEDPEGLVYERLVDPDNKVLSYEPMEPGRAVEIKSASYTVRERDVAHCQGGDGQLPFLVLQDEQTPFADLEGPEGTVGSIEFGEDGTRVFVGKPVSLADLNLTVTRQDIGLEDIPLATKTVGGRSQLTILAGKQRALNCSNCGGGMEVSVEGGVPSAVKCPYCGHVEDLEAKEISCPTCSASITLKSGSEAGSVTCGECWSQLNLQGDIPVVLKKLQKPKRLNSPIALGSIFSWEGTDYEVTGWIRNKGHDDGETYYWDEFQLFSEKGGYMWLELSDGHSSLGRRINDGPALSSPREAGWSIIYDQTTFKVAEVGEGKVHWVEGELPWVAQKGDVFSYVDAVQAPYRLGGEWTANETEWFISEYLPREELFACLSTTPTIEPITGVAPHQPYPRGATQVAVMSFIFMILSFLGVAFDPSEGDMVGGPWSFSPESGVYQSHGSKTKEFEVPEPGNYVVKVEADKLDNAWAFVRGDFDSESGTSTKFSTQLAVYPDLSRKFQSKNARETVFTVNFKTAGKHTLNIQAEAASVFTGVKKRVKVSRKLGRRCTNPKRGDRVIAKKTGEWKLGRISRRGPLGTFVLTDDGKSFLAYANEYLCIDEKVAAKAAPGSSSSFLKGPAVTPKLTVTLQKSPPFLDGFGFLATVSIFIFCILLFHRWSFGQRQGASMSTSYIGGSSSWGDDDD